MKVDDRVPKAMAAEPRARAATCGKASVQCYEDTRESSGPLTFYMAAVHHSARTSTCIGVSQYRRWTRLSQTTCFQQVGLIMVRLFLRVSVTV
jgi:hypothetical protein